MAREGLAAVRGALERRPRPAGRDPFAVDAERAVAGMKIHWNDLYAISAGPDGFTAIRRHGRRVTLTAETPDRLIRLMAEDAASW